MPSMCSYLDVLQHVGGEQFLLHKQAPELFAWEDVPQEECAIVSEQSSVHL